ncbi:DUF983 domain-containing protein [Flavicella sediminum]|uniref:DUF983 domain-containing protein n=1 Tax=Flavicella sediminum TaxID=2585141 RepID=UPI001120F54F|nr:DUF983 domain-containing protein [Flavicella sediminum]
MFLKKGSKLYSILKFKCPQCHEGEFFIDKRSFKLSKLTQLHEHCPNCNLKYMMEPSFFYGAMYVAYGLTVGLSILIFVISNLVFGLDLLESFLAIIILLLITGPINLKFSRIIWINIFVKYKAQEKK